MYHPHRHAPRRGDAVPILPSARLLCKRAQHEVFFKPCICAPYPLSLTVSQAEREAARALAYSMIEYIETFCEEYQFYGRIQI
jgi:hypothetical protein